MIQYRTILFDADDTLLDFKQGENVALHALFREMNLENEAGMMEEYKDLNQHLWKELERGKLTRDYVLNKRFSMLFKNYNIIVDGEAVENRYRYYLDLQHECIEGAVDLLKSLYHNYKLYIITNGVTTTQYKRLNDAGINQYFENIFISEDIGYNKPMKEYFEIVMKRIPDFNIKSTLVVGDSLTADILGGAQFNMDTCWFNRYRKENDTSILPTYEITHLNEIRKILSGV